MPVPIPISPDASNGILAGLAMRNIEFRPESVVTALDPATNTATLHDGGTIAYDLFLGVPIHRAPAVVEAPDWQSTGGLPVDHTTFATSFPDVYTVGDVTSTPVPRVGVIAEGEARTVGEVLIHRLRGGDSPEAYTGRATCYIEFGGDHVAKFDVDFLSGPSPSGVFSEPSPTLAASKQEFGATRRARWFGRPS